MLIIPNDIFEQDLTSWLFSFKVTSSLSVKNQIVATFLYEISKAQMMDRRRGDDFPFIADITIEEENHWILRTYKDSENIQIRAFCKDVLCKYTKGKDKIDLAISASEDYLGLYERLESPWFLLRAVSVRSYKIAKDSNFIDRLCDLLRKRIFPGWMRVICEELRKSYSTEELKNLSLLIKENIKNILDPKHREDERFYISSLLILGFINKTEYFYQMALSYEAEVDYINAHKEQNTIYPRNVDILQNAYNEIYKIRADFAEDFVRIKNKLLKERLSFVQSLQQYGVKTYYLVSEDFKNRADQVIENYNIQDAADVIVLLRGYPFVPQNIVEQQIQKYSELSSISSMFGCQQLQDKGLTMGVATPEEAIRIDIYKQLRLQWNYVILKSLSKINDFDENELGQVLCESCKSTYIHSEQILFWVRGIISGLKGDFFSSTHFLSPQIERSLVNKAESIYGDLSALNREGRQDAVGLSTALEKLKDFFKDDIYNDLRFFLIMGADVNLRNNVAHGLWNLTKFEEHGPYLWWIALKMYFCEDEIFD